jgi:putative transposase
VNKENRSLNSSVCIEINIHSPELQLGEKNEECMPYVRIWVHLFWATKNREPVLRKEIRKQIFRHIKQNAEKKDIHLDTINGHIEHVHALISLKKTQTISKVAQMLKGESSKWANENNLVPGDLDWQDEYTALSVSESRVEHVRKYIKNQEEHHRKKSFSEEYDEFLKKHGFKR